MTDKHKALLIEKYPVWPMADLLKILPYSKEVIKGYAQRLHVCKKGTCYSWKYEDEQKLIELYPNMKNANLAVLFNKTQGQVDTAAFKLKLFKSKEFKYECSKAGMFKPGTIPPNKGKKQSEYMKPEVIERTKATRFKKGQQSVTELYDGCIRVRTNKRGVDQKFIRLSKNHWIHLQIYNWEQANGPVPKGYRLRCLTDDQTNCDLSNWELITLKEHMLRNSCSLNITDGFVALSIVGGRRYDRGLLDELLKQPELINIKRQAILLNRAIKQHGSDNNQTAACQG